VKNALINENQTCNLITLNAKLNVTKILDKFSTKNCTPPVDKVAQKETNKQKCARKREEEEGL
jgi:hypothetical protein